jgi:hypothetical protein
MLPGIDFLISISGAAFPKLPTPKTAKNKNF